MRVMQLVASAAAEAKGTRVQEKYQGHVLDETTAEELEDTKGEVGGKHYSPALKIDLSHLNWASLICSIGIKVSRFDFLFFFLITYFIEHTVFIIPFCIK